MPEEIFNEKFATKILAKLEEKPLLIFLFLSISFSIWTEMSKEKAEDRHRLDMAEAKATIAQQIAENKVIVKEREMAYQEAILAQAKTIQLLPYVPPKFLQNLAR